MSTPTSTATGLRTGTLPKVNLLPTEISEGARFRNLQAALALAVILAVGVIGLLTYMASGEVSDAQQQVDAAQAQTSQLQAQVTSYSEVPKLRTRVDLAEAQLNQAMGQEVRYSFVLRDLSLSIPSSVFLQRLTITQPVDTPGSVVGAWGNNGIASITFHGDAMVFTDLAAWLDSLTKAKYYSDPYVSTATRPDVKAGTAFQFDSTVLVTQRTLTHRYDQKAGG